MTNLFNTFENGKCYQHNSGMQMHICGVVDTFMYGTCFIAEEGWNKEKLKALREEADKSEGPKARIENGWSDFRPVSMDPGSAVGWFEISSDEFNKNNFC